MKRITTFLLALIVTCSSLAQSDHLLDSLTTQFETADTDSARCYWLFRLAWVNFRDNADASEDYTDQAMAIAEAIPDSGMWIKGVYYKGLINRLRGSYDSSLVYLEQALDFYQRKGTDMHTTGPLFNIAVVHSYLGNLETSIQYYMQELAINEKNGNESSVANSLNSIGIINRRLERFDQALGNYEEALEIFTRLDEKWGMANVISNIGNVYSDQGRDDEAIQQYQMALDIDREIEDDWGSAYNLHAIGMAKLRQGDLLSAVSYMEDGLALRREIGARREISESLNGLAGATQQAGRLDEAAFYAGEALEIAQEIGSLQDQISGASLLASIHAEKGDFREAYDFQSLILELRDSATAKENLEVTADLLEKYESEKKDRELAENDLVIARDKTKIKNQQLFLTVIIAAAIGLGMLLLFVFRQARNRQRLQEEKLLVAQREQELMSVKAMIAGEEQERSRIARELHDGLSGMLAAVKLQFGGIRKRVETEGFDEAIESLDGASREVRRIAHNMMPEMLMKYGLIEALKDFCATINSSGVLSVDFQYYGMEEKLESSTELVIYRIVQELLNNIIKHSGANEAIIQMNRVDERLTLTVEDNGKGFDVKNSDEEGLGMKNLRSRVDYLNGELNIESDSGMGTSVYIEFNLLKS